jgi:ribose transport system permease protein
VQTRNSAAADMARRAPVQTFSSRVLDLLRRSEVISGIYLLIALVIFFSLLRPESFATMSNFRVVLSQQAIPGILALATLLPLACGQLDISAAANMGLAVVVVGWLQLKGVDTFGSIALTCAMGAVIGAVIAFVVLRLEVSALITTLGMASVLGALGVWLSDNQGFSGTISASLADLGQRTVLTIAIPVFYLLALAAVIFYVMEFTPFGRYMRATGDNPEAASLAGVRVQTVSALCFIAGGTLASLAGVIYAASIGSSPLKAGDPLLLASFTAVFLGATQFKRNQFNVPGTVLAVYLLATIVSGLLILYPTNSWLSDFFQGAALILAVALTTVRRRRRLRPLVDTEA